MLSQTYDNNEYEMLAKIEVTTSLMVEHCDDSNIILTYVPLLEYDTHVFQTYTKYTPNNSELSTIADILRTDVDQFKKQYFDGKATSTYCKIKTKLFLNKIHSALEASAGKIRN